MSDPNHVPAHYTKGGIDPLEFSMSNNLGFAEGNIIKYVYRYDLKGGVQDLLKARECLDRLIAQEKRKVTVPPSPKEVL